MLLQRETGWGTLYRFETKRYFVLPCCDRGKRGGEPFIDLRQKDILFCHAVTEGNGVGNPLSIWDKWYFCPAMLWQRETGWGTIHRFEAKDIFVLPCCGRGKRGGEPFYRFETNDIFVLPCCDRGKRGGEPFIDLRQMIFLSCHAVTEGNGVGNPLSIWDKWYFCPAMLWQRETGWGTLYRFETNDIFVLPCCDRGKRGGEPFIDLRQMIFLSCHAVTEGNGVGTLYRFETKREFVKPWFYRYAPVHLFP